MQYTNVIAIDPSTTCTGLCINGKVSCVVSEEYATTKKGDFSKWFEIASGAATIHAYSDPTGKPITKSTPFHISEVHKLLKYDYITDYLISQIKKEIPNLSSSLCLIEGYSYNSMAGNLIDLVTYSTLIRQKIIRQGAALRVLPPAELKMCAAKLTYEGVDVGKKKPKIEWRNNEGVAAGRFTKHEMYKAICENPDLDDDWKKLLDEHLSDQISSKSISKPLDDINDSYLLYHCFKAGHINT